MQKYSGFDKLVKIERIDVLFIKLGENFVANVVAVDLIQVAQKHL
jgi:hypothetical protein